MYNAIVRNDCHYDKSIWLQCKLTKYPKFCHMDFKATVPHLYKEHNIHYVVRNGAPIKEIQISTDQQSHFLR